MLPFALRTNITRLWHVCAKQVAGEALLQPGAFSQAGTAKSTGKSDDARAAKRLLPSEARPGVTCLLSNTLPGVTPGLCKTAEVQAQ